LCKRSRRPLNNHDSHGGRQAAAAVWLARHGLEKVDLGILMMNRDYCTGVVMARRAISAVSRQPGRAADERIVEVVDVEKRKRLEQAMSLQFVAV